MRPPAKWKGDGGVKQPTPKWQAHSAVGYDSQMTTICDRLLVEIQTDPERRQAILADPRELHRELFAPFAPASHAEYAGTYRGTANTTLVDRRISAESQLELGTEYEFCLPGEVASRMAELLKNAGDLLADTNPDDFGRLIALTYTFCWFGKIHPFLDGNGHVQRAIFAAMATEFGYPLSARFAIHPRPYDRLLATALEIFTRAPTGKENEELGLVAEYLAFFLDGPFKAPRKHVGSASPYTS
ncbi:Fic family protein [Mesorhizobium sediminum]|nr:Fic family protein [Mesorhizobium sediminum]